MSSDLSIPRLLLADLVSVAQYILVVEKESGNSFLEIIRFKKGQNFIN